MVQEFHAADQASTKTRNARCIGVKVYANS
jgi:hypothetical protein